MEEEEGASASSSSSDLQQLLLSRRTVNDFAPALPEGWEAALEQEVTDPRHREALRRYHERLTGKKSE